MLPFLLKQKPQSGVIIEQRKPDESKEPEQDQGLEACLKDMIDCIEAKDAKGAASAFKAAFQICENQPHEEYNDSEDQEDSE